MQIGCLVIGIGMEIRVQKFLNQTKRSILLSETLIEEVLLCREQLKIK